MLTLSKDIHIESNMLSGWIWFLTNGLYKNPIQPYTIVDSFYNVSLSNLRTDFLSQTTNSTFVNNTTPLS